MSITGEDISNAKAGGASNNDWICTQQILETHGVKAPLDEVTKRFEEFYQGTDHTTGLWQTETLIPRKSLLRFLASQVPLAIVTGRPRADAVRFLKFHGIFELFQTLVCMEDAPSKPDPAPVNLALSNCSLDSVKSSIIMVGDTPNDALVRAPLQFALVVTHLTQLLIRLPAEPE